jgi:crossover junction endodeoxyribonuclease RuvC
VIVLGIDPGTASVGYGLVERTGSHLRAVDYGAFETSADLALPERLQVIFGLLTELIELHRPVLVGVERVFHSRNVQTALAVGHARGVVLLAAAQHGIPVREATPGEVKVAVSGYGAADKEQVQRMVQVILDLPEPPSPDDAADALAVAIWTAHAERPGERLNARLLDRAAVAPRGGETRYERAVRDALARESPAGLPAPGGDGRGDGKAVSSGRAAGEPLPGEADGAGPRRRRVARGAR